MATIEEFAGKIKAKYPQYQDMEDSVLAEKMLAKYPQYRDMIDAPAQPQQAVQPDPEAERAARLDKAVTASEAMFPRTSRAIAENKSYFRQALGSGLDLLSLPGRGVAAASTQERTGGDPYASTMGGQFGVQAEPTQLTPAQEGGLTFPQSLSDTEGGNMLGKIVRDPGTGAAALAAPVTGPLFAGIRGGAWLANAGRAAAGGGIEGAASATAHQLENVAEGRDISPLDAAAEIAISSALPGLGSAGKTLVGKAGKAGKAGGKKILESIIKPEKKLTRGRGSKFDAENIFKYGLDGRGGLQAMDSRITEFRDGLNQQFGKELQKYSDNPFDISDAFKKARKEMQQELSKGEHADVIDGVEAGMDYWDKYLKKTSLNIDQGKMPIADLAALRKGVGAASKFDATNPQAVKGAERFSEKFYQEINEQLTEAYPELRKLDKPLSETKPIEQAVQDALPRVQKHNYASLYDIITLAGAVGGGAFTDDPRYAIPGALLFAGQRASRSPGVASALYRTGRTIAGEAEGYVPDLLKAGGRGTEAAGRRSIASMVYGDDERQGK